MRHVATVSSDIQNKNVSFVNPHEFMYAVEAAHRRQLIAPGVLSPESMLLSGSAFPTVCMYHKGLYKTTSFSFVSPTSL